ncbi:GDSL esterase/lipase At4g01130 [Selaginella moellendorffii]|nr:GDSL esterase/lipase At4g01130 [Selaginella moellendorffii]|eukprot:XP_002963929.2 GDSL esterase/lipase At4g01130 [Selaginella moellendorffii]
MAMRSALIGILAALFLFPQASIGASASSRHSQDGRNSSSKCFPLLFSFGDSLTDTGNAQRIFPFEQNRASHSPYGRTFFGRPRDRFSDGRLMIDFIAEALGLPFLSPYVQAVGSSFQHGVNFATSGATATDITFLVPHTLGVQCYWLKKFKVEVQDARSNPVNTALLPDLNSFSKALYVVFIGGNDYNARLFVYNMTIDQLFDAVPVVVDEIGKRIEDLYAESARNFLIVNVPPVGCTPELLTFFNHVDTNPEDYDSAGCFTPYNAVLEAHNDVLMDAVNRLRNVHPDGLFVYADYYRITGDILRDPQNYGMEDVIHACCGTGGRYNFNVSSQCGSNSVVNGLPFTPPSCPNPAAAANWDGVHPTEAFTKIIASSFLQGRYIEPHDAFDHCHFDFSNF